MKTIFITKGLPASGKSTWAKKKCMEYPNTVIINRDSIRTMLKGEYKNFPFGSSMEKLVTDLERYTVNNALGRGYNVIIDATNFRLPLQWIVSLCSYHDCRVEEVDFTDVSVEECIERDSKREFPVGEEVIRRMAQKYLNYEFER
jgi:predicted kinase